MSLNVGNNVGYVKARAFAIRIIRLCRILRDRSREHYGMINQLSRSGTSIGANLAEATMAQTQPDFIAKVQISLKECSETSFWLDIMHETGVINDAEYDSMDNDCDELIRILISTLKTAKSRL